MNPSLDSMKSAPGEPIPLIDTRVLIRYIGDLEREVRSLEEEVAAGDQDHSIPSSRVSPAPVEHTVSLDHQDHSPNFIEGGGLRLDSPQI